MTIYTDVTHYFPSNEECERLYFKLDDYSIPEDAVLTGLGGVTPTSFKPGHKTWNKGKKCPQLSESKKAYWETWRLENPEYKSKWKVNNYKKTGYDIEARSERAKARNKIKVTCPHCEKIGQLANMKRWHFDNCKYNSKA